MPARLGRPWPQTARQGKTPAPGANIAGIFYLFWFTQIEIQVTYPAGEALRDPKKLLNCSGYYPYFSCVSW